jgi:SAM-dependent methyltransferase
MDKENTIKQIKNLVPWYQYINLDGVMTLKKGNQYYHANAGEHTWNVIKGLLPSSLNGMRILDLGCNAGFYSVKSFLLGAKEVIGIDMSPIFLKQAFYVKDFFEKFYSKKFNIEYIKSDIGDLDLDNMGNFDYIFAISVLYHIGKHKYGKYTPEALNEQIEVVEKLSKHTKKFIVRCRNAQYNNRKYYGKIFKKAGFIETKFISEGKRGMILYEKQL